LRKLGLKVALSAEAAEGRIVIVDSMHEGVESKTRLFLNALDSLLGGQSLAVVGTKYSVLCREMPPTKAQASLPSKRNDIDRNDGGGRSGTIVPTWVSNTRLVSKNPPAAAVHIVNQ